MELRNVICLVVDRLQPALLGAYGNSWIRTPQIDRLAAESFLFDRAVADSLELGLLYRGFWQGMPAVWPDDAGLMAPSIVTLANQAGFHTALLTDDPLMADLSGAAEFAERTLLATDPPRQLADEIEETQAARFLASASGWLAEPRQSFLLWLAARGLSDAWDAPYALRRQYADDEDPPPPRVVAPPCLELPDEFDPDELLGLTHAYAGQVSLWDMCIGAWLDEFRSSQLARSTLLVFLSPRGFPLGEHRRVGPVDQSLYNESVQIPWLMCFPDALGASARSQALIVPADLPHTLAEWLGWPGDRVATTSHSLLPLVRWETNGVRDCVVMSSGADEWAVRTPAWHLRASGSGESRRIELYSKPSDRYEVNDVADRAGEIVHGLLGVLDQVKSVRTSELGALDPVLLAEVD